MAVYSATVTMSDGRNESTFDLHVNAADFANASAKIQGIVEALNDPTPAVSGAQPMTLGIVTEVALKVPLDIAAWQLRTGAAGLGAENQKGGRFIWNNAGGFPNYFTVPTFNEAYKASTGYLIDPSGTGSLDQQNMLAFINAVVSDAQGAGSDRRGFDITSLNQAYFTYGGKPAYK